MKKILAIDDQKDNLTSIKAVIKSNIPNCKIFTALSGKEGIEIAKKEQPDTILLDIIMPEMDGYEVCKRVKEEEATKHIPIVMITAIKTDAESRIKGLTLGADAFLAKPIDAIDIDNWCFQNSLACSHRPPPHRTCRLFRPAASVKDKMTSD